MAIFIDDLPIRHDDLSNGSPLESPSPPGHCTVSRRSSRAANWPVWNFQVRAAEKLKYSVCHKITWTDELGDMFFIEYKHWVYSDVSCKDAVISWWFHTLPFMARKSQWDFNKPGWGQQKRSVPNAMLKSFSRGYIIHIYSLYPLVFHYTIYGKIDE